APLAKSSAAQSKGHQFLEIDSNVTRYNATHLNLGNAMFDNLPLNVDSSGSNDGVVFWRDTFNNSNYVGIAPNINLGAPLAIRSTVAQMIWRGEIDAIGTSGHGTVNSDLTVNVNFYAGLNDGNVGWIEATSADSENIDGRFGGGRDYYINGKFNRAGVLRGTATLNSTRHFSEENPAIKGQLRGLIGVEGVVGAFLGSSTAGDFVGGFVAQPGIAPARTIVDDAVWAASSTGTLYSSPQDNREDPVPNPKGWLNQFLKSNPAGFANSSLDAIEPDHENIAFGGISANLFLIRRDRTRGDVLSLDSGGLGTVYYRSGFTLYYSGLHDLDLTRYYYAGLGSDANVGRTIHPDPAHYPANVNGMATWSGQFKATRNGENNTIHTNEVYYTHQNLNLTIDFNNKRVFSGTAGVPNGTNIGDNGDGRFDINGNWNTRGVLTGTVNQVIDVAPGADPHADSGSGILRGIIGDRGAIGAFISYGTGKQGFSGGFFVCPAYNTGITGECP
nr:hypothetical protein [Pseudomonadota bacterium]